MALLLEEDYVIVMESGLEYQEDEVQRFFVMLNFPVGSGLYVHGGTSIDKVEVLWIVPLNYNTSGGDMFWVHPALVRADGNPIPAVASKEGPLKHFNGKEYYRWSRHWPADSWRPKIDNIQKVLDRIEWALKKPEANR